MSLHFSTRHAYVPLMKGEAWVCVVSGYGEFALRGD